MANEEHLSNLTKRLAEVARKATQGDQPHPPEASPEGQQVSVESASGTTRVESTPNNTISVAAERLAEAARKLSEGIPETAQRILGSQEEFPTDARVFSVVEQLMIADESKLADAGYMRDIGKQLVGIIQESGYGSPAGIEARKYLKRITDEHPSLIDLRVEAMPAISGGSDVPPTEEPEQPLADDGPRPSEAPPEEYLHEDPLSITELIQSQSGVLYDQYGDDPLANTPFAEDLRNLQYRLQVDPKSIYTSRNLLESTIQRIIEKGQREGVDPARVQQAVNRIRNFETFADIQYQKYGEKESGRRLVRWSEVKGNSPDPELHSDEEIFPDFHYIPAADVETILEGPEGEANWYFNFIDQIYSLGREETRPTLTQDQRFQEFKDYLVWKYGPEYNLAVEMYQKHWDSRGQFEYAVKGLMYNPGDVKDRLKAMSLLTGADLDHLYKNFDHSNEAYSLYESVVFETMSTKRENYAKAIRYLKDKIDWNGQTMSREDVLKEMKSKMKSEGFDPKEGKTKTPLSIEDQKLMLEIQKQMDLAAEGVMLWDDDVQSYTELHITLSKLRNAREGLLKKKSEGIALTESEMDQLSEVDRLYEIYAHREQMLNENFTQELLETRGLSPVDIEVRKRLIAYLKSQHPENPNYQPQEYEVRMALWAARTAMIGSGRMAMIGAMMSIPPGVEYGTNSGKHVMRAPAFEDLQRIFNPETFASRFSVGGDMGLTARSILRRNLLRSKGIDPGDPTWYQKISGATERLGSKFHLTHTPEWKHSRFHEHDAQKQMAYETWEFAEDVSGISFSELLGPGFMASGGFYDGTGWRLEKGVFDELRNKVLSMKKLPENAALLDNQALSIQLLTSGSAAERRPVLDRMLRRTPSKFLELLGNDTDRILAKNNVSPDEWKKVKEALSLAELKISHEKDWQFARVDFAEPEDFNALMVPFLRMAGMDDARMGAMRQIFVDIQKEVYRERPVDTGGGRFRNKMDAIAALKLPLTMSMNDFNWGDSNFYQLGTVAMHRRIRDVGAQMRARDGMFEFISNQEMLLSPNDYTKSLEKIREIREAIVDYSGADAAEGTAKEMLRVLFEMNRHRSLWSPGNVLIPGWTGLMKNLAELDLRPIENNWMLRKIFGDERWRHFAHEKITHWPHSVGEGISYSVKFTGAHANHWDEIKMEEILRTALDQGIFINHPEYVQDLRREFHTGWADRWLSLPRKYWWIIILATIGIAATQAVEEQKGGGGGGHH